MEAIRLNPAFSSRTIGDSIYLNLRQAILSLDMKPGAELNIQQLSDMLGVSRSPVRDALMRLSGESLVDVYPQRGCRVSPIDLTRVGQELFLREGLETLAMARFAQTASEEAFARMERCLQSQQRHLDDPARLMRDDEDFHGALYDDPQRRYALEILRTHSAHYQRVRFLSYQCSDIRSGVICQHQAILDALRARDIDLCAQLEREHLHHVDGQLSKLLTQYPDYFLS